MKKKMLNRSRLAALSLVLGLALTGCGNGGKGTGNAGNTGNTAGTVTPDTPKPEAGITNLSEKVTKIDVPETAVSKSHGDALAKSGVLLLQKSVELAGDNNINYLISPFSIQMALGMTAAGSDEGSSTEKQMMEVLLPGLSESPSALNKEMATFAKKMENDKSVSWNVANSIWANNNGAVKLSDSYVADAANYYDAELFSAPFNDTTRAAVNDWVKQETRERIPSILDNPIDNSRIILVNALAFDGKWETAYEEYDILEDQEFTNADGSKSKVTLLGSKEDSAFHIAGGLGFIRPYEGGQYSFVGILPSDGMSTDEYLKQLAADERGFASSFLAAEVTHPVYVRIPEFKTEFGLTLDETLKALGMTAPYENASFGKMVTSDSNSVEISTVAHKAMIEVDRTGTKAAAATAVVMTENVMIEEPEPYYIFLDRPFIYGIVDNESGVPIFLGVQNSMAE